MFAIIQAAGWPIYFLLAVSIIAVALIIERFMILRKEKIVPGGLLEKVLAAYQKQGVSEDMLEKLSQDSPLGQVLASGLRNYKSSRYVMKDAIEEAGSAVAHELERFLTTLGTIATISPLMGLFGTVVGIVIAFQGLSGASASSIQAVAPGIAEALIATAAGIAAAVPAAIFYNYFLNRVKLLTATIDRFTLELLNLVEHHYVRANL